MCGIAGFVGLDIDNPRKTLQKMMNALKHRGPDDSGIWNSENTWLGHQRLSIIDLQFGHQPMASDPGVVVVFNGEIYNYIELREQLKKKGYRFHTNCDTEVLLYLFEEYGEQMTSFLRGMFAFVIWNSKEHILFAAIDRLGQKPLYYYTKGECLVFASELDALMSCAIVPKEISWENNYLYFKYGYIPSPYTCYKNVFKLEAGHQFLFKDGILYKSCYWQNKTPVRRNKNNVNELIEELDVVLKKAVKSQLISDVPLGAFLSGGLDSSLIVALMKECNPSEVKTFSIGFNEPTYDESHYSKFVASTLGVSHQINYVHLDSINLLDVLIKHFGEPFGDSSSIPTWYLSKFTKESVKVALSGDGGDEIFGGYRRYVGRRLIKYYQLVPKHARDFIVDNFLRVSNESTNYTTGNFVKMLRHFHFNSKRIDDDTLDYAPNILSRDELQNLFLDFPLTEDLLDPVKERATRFLNCKPEEQMMFLDQETYLEDDINVKVDRMSMANSLEVRSPFLDHNVVEFMASLPLEMKLNGFTTKFLLKKLSVKKIPRSIVYRKKQGFNAPVGKWFFNELLPIWNDVIEGQSFKDIPFNKPLINKLWNDHQSKRRDNGYILWHFLIFGLWFNKSN
jgi:asparagine synthase (glutamine-hydrolysing)